ncbi:hypothetical protein [Flavivirga jejuensis]|uniref:DUF4374 domain-containing protein n=1 Tax=Flavivirga jejuensis TaxID=870487 RepID=A0ABT8WSF2_9FLAO|nr:hypothetical protein [Flavivirga jejuensis]MDO5976127.1 hypothetical protein [Flavivirga jejuensis]
MKIINFKFLTTIALTVLFFFNCSNNDDTPNEGNETTTGYAFWLITDTSDSSGLILTSEEMLSGDINPTDESYNLIGAARTAGISYKGAIYNTSNNTGDSGIQKFTYEDNSLSDAGFISVGESAFIFEMISETAGYYTDSDRSRTAIQTFNPETMQRTGEIDIADKMAPYMTDDVVLTRLGSFMVASEGFLYTQVFFFNASGVHAFDKTYVAVIDTNTNEFVNMAEYNDYLYLGYDRKNTNFVTKADNGTIYLAAPIGIANEIGSKCIRINAGETDFDASWEVDFNEIIGEEGSFLLGGPAVSGDKLYVKLKSEGMAPDYSNFTNIDGEFYIIDINNTSVATKIEEIPSSGGQQYGNHGPTEIDGLIYFLVSSDTYQGYYTYNLTTGEVLEAITFEGGMPCQLVKINE